MIMFLILAVVVWQAKSNSKGEEDRTRNTAFQSCEMSSTAFQSCQQKHLMIWFGVKLLQSSNTHQNETKPLSEAFFGMMAKRLRLFSEVILTSSSGAPIVKAKQLRKHAKLGMKLIRSSLDRCFVADLLVSEHAAYSGRCKITLQSWWTWMFCFLVDRRRRPSPFRTLRRTNLPTRMKSCWQQDWNLVTKISFKI